MESIDCIICKSSKSSLFKHFIATDDKLVKCSCGFVYLNPRPDLIEIKKFYSKNYAPHNNNNFIYRFLQKISYKWKYLIINKLTKNKGLHLDVGSGTDSFCKYLKAKGWKSLSYDKFNNSKLSCFLIFLITSVISRRLIFSTLSKFTSGKTICSLIPNV